MFAIQDIYVRCPGLTPAPVGSSRAAVRSCQTRASIRQGCHWAALPVRGPVTLPPSARSAVVRALELALALKWRQLMAEAQPPGEPLSPACERRQRQPQRLLWSRVPEGRGCSDLAAEAGHRRCWGPVGAVVHRRLGDPGAEGGLGVAWRLVGR